jgi:hypothetical protein
MGVGRASRVAGVIFAAAALAVVVLNVLWPFERGWWLATYLFLVGCCSQVLLGAGQVVPATRRATPWTALALWNLGTATVALADMGGGLVGVAAGGPHGVARSLSIRRPLSRWYHNARCALR